MDKALEQNIRVWARRLGHEAPPTYAHQAILVGLAELGFTSPGRQAAMVVAAGHDLAVSYPALTLEQRRYIAFYAAQAAYEVVYGNTSSVEVKGVSAPDKVLNLTQALAERMVAARTAEKARSPSITEQILAQYH